MVFDSESTISGHTDYAGELDSYALSLSSSGFYDLHSTGATETAVWDDTAKCWLRSTSETTYCNNLYIDATHTNYFYVRGHSPGEEYTVYITANIASHSTDYNSSDLTPDKTVSVSAGCSGHTDFSGDVDFGKLSVSSSGYYDLKCTGSTEAAVFDVTADRWLAGSSTSGNGYDTNVYIDASHSNLFYVRGSSAGENYTAGIVAHGTGTTPDNASSFKITFDYRYDTTGFFTDAWKSVLESAAALWEKYIADDFAAIIDGTTVSVDLTPLAGGTEHAATVSATDSDLVIFVAAGSMANSGVLACAAPISSDTDADFEPSFGRLMVNPDHYWFLDSSPESSGDIEPGSMDAIYAMAHEIGHILGIGGATAYNDLVIDNIFTGAYAKEANGGAYVTLFSESNSAHLAGSDDLMYPYISDGRKTPSGVDFAILKDIGYEIR